jgi:hypothetical protein
MTALMPIRGFRQRDGHHIRQLVAYRHGASLERFAGPHLGEQA